ncbi:MAG: S1C family serine protease [Aggregatilineales bacterium]
MSDLLTNVSNELAAAAETAGQGVVRVEGRLRQAASGIVWSGDGVIVTSHHVVERDDNLKVGLPNGETVSATLVGRDPSTDLAVLRAEAKGLTPIGHDSFGALRVGHLVLAVGRPGKDVNVTLGVVSALGEAWQSALGGKIDHYLQTDVTMFPGFSGGPLIDVSGQALGINTSAMRDVSLTIPMPTVQRVVETLLKHGKVKRGYLGVGTQPVRLPGAIREQVKQETGLLIASVESDSPAEKGGLLIGDTLIHVGGQAVRNVDELAAQLGSETVGAAVEFTVMRGGQIQQVTVTIGERS